jgi:hypothetical protein
MRTCDIYCIRGTKGKKKNAKTRRTKKGENEYAGIRQNEPFLLSRRNAPPPTKWRTRRGECAGVHCGFLLHWYNGIHENSISTRQLPRFRAKFFRRSKLFWRPKLVRGGKYICAKSGPNVKKQFLGSKKSPKSFGWTNSLDGNSTSGVTIFHRRNRFHTIDILFALSNFVFWNIHVSLVNLILYKILPIELP